MKQRNNVHYRREHFNVTLTLLVVLNIFVCAIHQCNGSQEGESSQRNEEEETNVEVEITERETFKRAEDDNTFGDQPGAKESEEDKELKTSIAKIYDDQPVQNFVPSTDGNGNVVAVSAVGNGANSNSSVPENEGSTPAEGNPKGIVVKTGRIKVACWDYRTMGVYNGSVDADNETETDSVGDASSTVSVFSGDDGTTSGEIEIVNLSAEDQFDVHVGVGSGGEVITDESTRPFEEQSATDSILNEMSGETVDSTEEKIADPKVLELVGEAHNKTVEIVNMTHLLHDVLYSNPGIKLRTTPANCSVVLFYTTWCPFSAKAAPHFNALPRAYPPLRVAAIDSSKYKSINTYFGILSVPTIVLFHNGRIIAKFNDSMFTLNKFSEFVEYFTDLTQEERMNVTKKDFEGPLPSTPTKERDWYLLISWVFLIFCFLHYISKSVLWRRAVDFVRTTWNEAEAHHDHEHQD